MTNPPRPRLCLNVGITGHRAENLPADADQLLEPVLTDIFRQLDAAVRQLHARQSACFSSDNPRMQLHTPLATGADQMAYRTARIAGYETRALLPFPPDIYREDFAAGEERDAFLALLADADSSFALPCTRSELAPAYLLVGKAVVAACDVLVAIWDGESANGPGGTAEIVRLALKANVPVIHIPIKRDAAELGQVQLLEGGNTRKPTRRPLQDSASYSELVGDLLMPLSAGQKSLFDRFVAEEDRRLNLRIEYPALLAILGVRKFSTTDIRPQSPDQCKESEFTQTIARQDRLLPEAYGWANTLAIRYAQAFRSSHVLNYALAALAVLMALSGLLLPQFKLHFVVVELAIIASLVINTWRGKAGEWHVRWLQYRRLAESLRTLPYLKRTGVAPPPFRANLTYRNNRQSAEEEWTSWYANAVWRDMENATGVLDAAALLELRKAVLDEQIQPQAKYHRANARRMHKLDHQLHLLGHALLAAVIITCVSFIVAYFVSNEWVRLHTNFFVFITAGLPAIGASVFGLRGHGEHLLVASRSSATADRLEAISADMLETDDVELLAARFEDISAAMLDDVDEWTTAYSERSLEIPA